VDRGRTDSKAENPTVKLAAPGSEATKLMRLELVHSFACSRADYEQKINCAKILEMTDGKLPYLKSRKLVEDKEGPGPNQHSWRFRCEADYKMPEAARKVLGDRLGWFEDSTFDRGEHTIKFSTTPDVLAGRYRCDGQQLFVERDDGGMDRIMTLELTIAIPLVGGMIEKTIAERLKETYAIEYEIQTEFFRSLAPKS
jgi:hypothetical protein